MKYQDEITIGSTVKFKNEQSGHYKGARYTVISIGAHNTLVIKLILISSGQRQMSQLVNRNEVTPVTVTTY